MTPSSRRGTGRRSRRSTCRLACCSALPGGSHAPAQDASFAFVVRHPADPDLAVGWLGATRADALPGLARKLPHYGKYSYLGFTGAEPTNVVKGQWPAVGSPLVRVLDGPVAAAKIPPREPLVRPAPVFDAGRMLSRVRHQSLYHRRRQEHRHARPSRT